MFEVYSLTGPTGKRYIGLSARLNGRVKNHRLIAKSGAKAWHPLYRAILKHGFGAFTVEVLARCETVDAAKAEEVRLIAALGTVTPGGYNVSRGGNYDGHAGGEAVKALLASDAGYRARRQAIGRRSAPAMHAGPKAESLCRKITAYRPSHARDEAIRQLAELEKKSNGVFAKSPTQNWANKILKRKRKNRCGFMVVPRA